MEIGPGRHDLGRPCGSHLRADRRCSSEPAARVARPDLHRGRISPGSSHWVWCSFQPLLVGGYLPGLPAYRRPTRAHRWIGGALVVAVLVHVGGLWITSPPDMIDALTFVSPTPFSAWGVVAMYAIFAVALSLAALRRRLGLRPRTWRIAHMSLAAVIVGGGVVHAMLVEGTMETISKMALCALVLGAAIKVMADLRGWRRPAPSRGEEPFAAVNQTE